VRQGGAAALDDQRLLGPWGTFLSGCVLYDPPADRLGQFANHHRFPDLSTDPVVWVRQDADGTISEIFRLELFFGSVLDAVWDAAAEWVPPAALERGKALAREMIGRKIAAAIEALPPARPLIDPYTDLSVDEIKEAAKRLRAERPTIGALGGAPRSGDQHPIVDIQCAIWRYGPSPLSWDKIAARMGWSVAEDNYEEQPNRCASGERHAGRGAKFLREAGRGALIPNVPKPKRPPRRTSRT
jgi:hypothetical protein